MTPCGEAKLVDHADKDQTGPHPGDITVYTCHLGYHFPEGGTVRTIICQANGNWTSDIRSCKGEITKYVWLCSAADYHTLCNLVSIAACSALLFIEKV